MLYGWVLESHFSVHTLVYTKVKPNNIIIIKFPNTEFSLESLEAVQVSLHGLGPFNYLGRKVIKDLVMQNMRVMLETNSKQAVKEGLKQFSIVDHLARVQGQAHTERGKC